MTASTIRTSSRTTRRSRTRSRRSRIDTFSEIDGGPYPSSSRGPIYTFNNATHVLRGRHTFKAGLTFEILGRGRLRSDQRSADPGQHEQPERPVPVHECGGRFAQHGHRGGRTRRSGCSRDYAEIGQRALDQVACGWRPDVFVQDSWRPTSNVTVEGGLRYVFWPPFHALDDNAATFDPAQLQHVESGCDRSGDRAASPRVRAITASSLPGDGFPSSASDLVVYNDPAVNALFIGAPARLRRHSLQRDRAAARHVVCRERRRRSSR